MVHIKKENLKKLIDKIKTIAEYLLSTDLLGATIGDPGGLLQNVLQWFID